MYDDDRVGKVTGVELANAYMHRGIAHQNKRELDLAIEDESQSIKLDPTDAWLMTIAAWRTTSKAIMIALWPILISPSSVTQRWSARGLTAARRTRASSSGRRQSMTSPA